MKLLRYFEGGQTHLGALEGETIIDLSPIALDYPTMLSIVSGGDVALARVKDTIIARERTRPSAGAHLLAPLERPGKFLAIGMNYRKHMAESERLGVPKPQQQFWFNKQTTCIAGPFDDIVTGVTEKLDYEVELAAIIGSPAKGVREGDARRHVFGYLVCNDVSARDWQFHSPTFMMGKSFDTHGPIGPWIVTADEIEDPHDLALRCFVNGKLRQESNTSEMVFNLWQQIAYLSTAFTLESGDMIATGTPEGVGIAMEPPSFLRPGDVVRCEIDGIGAIENRVVA